MGSAHAITLELDNLRRNVENAKRDLHAFQAKILCSILSTDDVSCVHIETRGMWDEYGSIRNYFDDVEEHMKLVFVNTVDPTQFLRLKLMDTHTEAGDGRDLKRSVIISSGGKTRSLEPSSCRCILTDDPSVNMYERDSLLESVDEFTGACLRIIFENRKALQFGRKGFDTI